MSLENSINHWRVLGAIQRANKRLIDSWVRSSNSIEMLKTGSGCPAAPHFRRESPFMKLSIHDFAHLCALGIPPDALLYHWQTGMYPATQRLVAAAAVVVAAATAVVVVVAATTAAKAVVAEHAEQCEDNDPPPVVVAAAVIVAATATAAKAVAVTEQQDKDDDPPPIVVVVHSKCLLVLGGLAAV